MEAKVLNRKLDEMISATARSKVAIIIPLFGYFVDSKLQQFTKNVLKTVLDRVYTNVHQTYLIFVAEEPRISKDVANIILGKSQGGNSKGVAMDTNSTYAQYIAEGLKVARETTDSQFFIIVNPWVLLQDNNIDIIVDRVNRDDVQIVSGYDLKGLVSPKDFTGHFIQIPKEERNINLDFIAMKRYVTDMISIDPNYKTHAFLAYDLWQMMFSKGFEVISSQHVPIYSFDVDWSEFEPRASFEADKAYFQSKWKFLPDVKYE